MYLKYIFRGVFKKWKTLPEMGILLEKSIKKEPYHKILISYDKVS